MQRNNLLLHQAPFIERHNFGSFLIQRGLKETAVEIGTDQGLFALRFLEQWTEGTLHCVDPWLSGYDPEDPTSHKNRQEDEAVARQRLENKARILKLTSQEAHNLFAPQSIDFVYIDGNHQPEYFLQDLRLWWRKLRPGGILGGHDIVCPGEHLGGWGRYLQPVLFEFAREIGGRPIHLVVELDGSPWSFYLEK